MQTRTATLSLLLSALALAACTSTSEKDSASPGEGADDSGSGGSGSGGDETETCFSDPPTLQVGTGESVWIPLDAGDPLLMVHGPQDGWHMLGSAWIENMLPIVEIHYTIAVKDGGEVVSDNFYRVALVEEDECIGFYPGMFGFLGSAVGDAPDVLSYETLVLSMTATDLEGRTATGSVEVTAVPDPVDLE